MPGEVPALVSKQQLFARIVGGLRGRADVIFREPDKCIDLSVKLESAYEIAKKNIKINRDAFDKLVDR